MLYVAMEHHVLMEGGLSSHPAIYLPSDTFIVVAAKMEFVAMVQTIAGPVVNPSVMQQPCAESSVRTLRCHAA
jgi:hypothetical protein